MHDLKSIRENPGAFDAGLARRGLPAMSADIIALDAEARAATARLNELQTRRNAASKAIGAAKGRGDEAEAQRLMAEVEAIKAEMPDAEESERSIRSRVDHLLAEIPNLPAADAPDGRSEEENIEVRRWGEARSLDNPREHFDLGEALGQMDFEAAAKMSGARFIVLSGGLARLERAIANLMLDTHTAEFGYREVSPPLLVKDAAAFGTGQLPKFEADLFAVRYTLAYFDALRRASDVVSSEVENMDAMIISLKHDIIYNVKSAEREDNFVSKNENLSQAAISLHQLNEQLNLREKLNTRLQEILDGILEQKGEASLADFWLIPTAEVSLTNLVADQIVDAEALPLRYTAWTPCFRSEAGAAGRDTRGMIRLHQFSKVELVSVTAPEASAAEHERMTECAEAILKKLELPFRTVALCTGDMGFSAEKTYDIEVWLPGQGRYREISSCSNCGPFQARRMKARLRRKGEKGTEFVHTLNGSGLAVGRTLVAILENYQQPDGSIAVPAALQSYMGGLARIERG